MNIIFGWGILLGALVGAVFIVGKTLYWFRWLNKSPGNMLYIGEMELLHRIEGLRRDFLREPVRTWFVIGRWPVLFGTLGGFAAENIIMRLL